MRWRGANFLSSTCPARTAVSSSSSRAKSGTCLSASGLQAIDHLEDSMVDLPDLGTSILQRIRDPFAVGAWWFLRHERVRQKRLRIVGGTTKCRVMGRKSNKQVAGKMR